MLKIHQMHKKTHLQFFAFMEYFDYYIELKGSDSD